MIRKTKNVGDFTNSIKIVIQIPNCLRLNDNVYVKRRNLN